MIVTLVIAIIIIGVTLNQYLSGTVLKSTLMLIASICGMILAFTYYEILAGFALSKGYGAGWALTGSLAIVFMISFVPAKIRVTRMSRQARAIGYSSQ